MCRLHCALMVMMSVPLSAEGFGLCWRPPCLRSAMLIASLLYVLNVSAPAANGSQVGLCTDQCAFWLVSHRGRGVRTAQAGEQYSTS